MILSRRSFLKGILATGTAPFIVKAGSLMATRVPESGLIIDAGSMDRTVLTVYGQFDQSFRQLYAQELAAAMRRHMDKTLFRIFTEGK